VLVPIVFRLMPASAREAARQRFAKAANRREQEG
jgi:hypothetical protein